MGLLDDVTEQKDKRNLIFDLDGVIYLSCYKHRESDNIELMYADLFERIQTIKHEIWKHYEVDETLLAITTAKNFRDDLTDKWKGDRKSKDEKTLTEKQLEAQRNAEKLKEQVKKVKALLYKRLSSSIVEASFKAEADDICIDKSKLGWIVVSQDGVDVIKQCRNPVFNYHKKHWKFVHDGLSEEEIFKNIIHLTIEGGHNGDFGIKGKGKVFANKFIESCEEGDKGFSEWVDLFPTPEEALMNYRLADCGQVHNDKVKLIGMKEIAGLFEEHMVGEF